MMVSHCSPLLISVAVKILMAGDASSALERAAAIARGVMLTRYLVEAPPNFVNPTTLAEAAALIASSFSKVRVSFHCGHNGQHVLRCIWQCCHSLVSCRRSRVMHYRLPVCQSLPPSLIFFWFVFKLCVLRLCMWLPGDDS